MRWPWSLERGSEMARRKAEHETEDARVRLRTLAAQLKDEIDRLDVIVGKLNERCGDAD
jgi:hypothetical protein